MNYGVPLAGFVFMLSLLSSVVSQTKYDAGH
jgi:hypothetical protein